MPISGLVIRGDWQLRRPKKWLNFTISVRLVSKFSAQVLVHVDEALDSWVSKHFVTTVGELSLDVSWSPDEKLISPRCLALNVDCYVPALEFACDSRHIVKSFKARVTRDRPTMVYRLSCGVAVNGDLAGTLVLQSGFLIEILRCVSIGTAIGISLVVNDF